MKFLTTYDFCISPKRSSELAILFHNWHIYILFLNFPLSAVRYGKFSNFANLNLDRLPKYRWVWEASSNTRKCSSYDFEIQTRWFKKLRYASYSQPDCLYLEIRGRTLIRVWTITSSISGINQIAGFHVPDRPRKYSYNNVV